MKDRPILFSAPMVRAILEDRKTQTRRAVKGAPTGPESYVLGVYHGVWGIHESIDAIHAFRACCPYGQPGDRLWVRERCRAEELTADAAIAGDFLSGDDDPLEGLDGVRYPADNHFRPIDNTPAAADAWGALNAYRGRHGATVPAIHMPRWASRILLEVTDVRVQRVQDISEKDARAEGAKCADRATGREVMFPDESQHIGSWKIHFREIWDSINAKRGFGWSANPWVWAISFKRLEPPA